MTERDVEYMARAARLALRGHGGAEPNPLVGCVIVSPDGEQVGWGAHRRCGGPHAEIHALGRAGDRARGATAYITLEPCIHEGRTGPCTEALLDAGIARVVAARPDPNPQSQGGSAQLEEAGVPFTWLPQCAAAVAVSEPFVHRSLTGLPWVVAKWAQTIDGRVATRSGASQWISSHLSRRLVHRERGRVDAIMTGIGTVLSDDPQLTARGVRRRRIARRVIIDPLLEIPIDAAVVRSAGDTPTTVACTTEAANDQADRATQLQAAGVQLVALPAEQGGLPLGLLLQQLSSAHDLSTVLVEAGPGLTSRLLSEGLVSEAWVFTAPLLLADDQAVPCVRGQISPDLADGMHLELIDQRRRGHDTVARYRVLPPERAP